MGSIITGCSGVIVVILAIRRKDWEAMGAISYFYNKIWTWRFQTYWNQVNSSCRKEKEIGINLEEETRIGPYHNDKKIILIMMIIMTIITIIIIIMKYKF